MSWQPPPRPQWVAELNAFGAQLGSPAALVALDEASLLEAARTATGLEDHAALQRHPDILDERVDAPVLVVGTGRSGTSLLHELLAQDPAHRVARTWELLHPCPPPERATYATDPRIAAADQEYRFWHLVVPEYRTMHENGGDVPNEDPLIDQLQFASDHFMGSYP